MDCSDEAVCDREPCENGGVCHDMGDSEYKCKCMDGYTGMWFCWSKDVFILMLLFVGHLMMLIDIVTHMLIHLYLLTFAARQLGKKMKTTIIWSNTISNLI